MCCSTLPTETDCMREMREEASRGLTQESNAEREVVVHKERYSREKLGVDTKQRKSDKDAVCV